MLTDDLNQEFKRITRGMACLFSIMPLFHSVSWEDWNLAIFWLMAEIIWRLLYAHFWCLG